MNFGVGNGVGFSDPAGGSGPPPAPQNLQQTLTVGNFTDLSILWDRIEPDPPFPGLATHVWQRFNPLVPGQPLATPFLISQSSQKNFANGNFDQGNDEVIDLGWNLAPGGGALVPGVPGIGLQFEGNYFPTTEQFVEAHEFYITPAGAQIRLKSWTVQTASGLIDLFFTTGHTSYKDPFSNLVYFSMTNGTSTLDQIFIDSATGETRGINYNSVGALKFMNIGLYSGNNDFAVTIFTDATVDAVGFSASAGFFEFKDFGGIGDVLPRSNGGQALGRANKKWLRITGIQSTFDYQEYIESAIDPTTADIPLGMFQVWHNTALDELRLWANVSNTLRNTPPLT